MDTHKATSSTNLQVSKLGKLLPAFVELTLECFDLGVNGLMRVDVALLCEALTTYVARVWTILCMSSLMCLRRIRDATDKSL